MRIPSINDNGENIVNRDIGNNTIREEEELMTRKAVMVPSISSPAYILAASSSPGRNCLRSKISRPYCCCCCC